MQKKNELHSEQLKRLWQSLYTNTTGPQEKLLLLNWITKQKDSNKYNIKQELLLKITKTILIDKNAMKNYNDMSLEVYEKL